MINYRISRERDIYIYVYEWLWGGASNLLQGKGLVKRLDRYMIDIWYVYIYIMRYYYVYLFVHIYIYCIYTLLYQTWCNQSPSTSDKFSDFSSHIKHRWPAGGAMVGNSPVPRLNLNPHHLIAMYMAYIKLWNLQNLVIKHGLLELAGTPPISPI